MALGKVSVNNLNLGQGAVTEIERYFLFIGPAGKNAGKLLPLNTDSDLANALGTADSDLKTQVTAARANGGDRWACVAAPIGAEGDWATALEYSQQQGYSVEGVVITRPVTSGAELVAMHTAAEQLSAKYGRRVFVMAASAGILPTATWDEYLVAQKAITADVAAPRVLLGLGAVPADKEGIPLPSAIRSELDKARFSVSQTYADYEGVYWGDANMLDTPASDYQVLEYLRLVDKAARQVRPLLIRRIGDRRLNSSAASMAANTSALMAPLRAMAKAVKFAGEVFPGEIQSPKDGDLVISWSSRTQVQVFLKIRPHNCPKDITANIALDLSQDNQE